MEPVGPSPLPERLYASRQLPFRRVARVFGRATLGIGIVAAFLALFVVSLYRTRSGSPLLEIVGRVMPLPAARMGKDAVMYRDVVQAREGWRRFYETAGTVEGMDMDIVESLVLARLVDAMLVRQLMREMGLELTDAARAGVEEAMMGAQGSEVQMFDEAARRFGWTREQFERYIVEPVAASRVLEAAILSSDTMQEDARARAQQMRRDVISGGQSFAEVASQLSVSLSAESGGELGVQRLEDYPNEARVFLQHGSVGDVSEVLELPERFVVYRLLERDERRAGVFVNAQELSVDKRDLDDVLRDRRATVRYFD